MESHKNQDTDVCSKIIWFGVALAEGEHDLYESYHCVLKGNTFLLLFRDY